MPWSDPAKNAESVRKWRANNPGYWKRYERSSRITPISRYAVLDEDVKQQAILFKLTHKKSDCPEQFKKKERRWIQATDMFVVEDGQEPTRRGAAISDEA